MERHKPLARRTGFKTKFAKQLRGTSSDAGRRLAAALSEHPIAGMHFQHRQKVGPFIVDFLCEPAKLAIVLDDDPDRAQWLDAAGYRVLTFAQREDPQAVLDAIARLFELRAVPPRSE